MSCFIGLYSLQRGAVLADEIIVRDFNVNVKSARMQGIAEGSKRSRRSEVIAALVQAVRLIDRVFVVTHGLVPARQFTGTIIPGQKIVGMDSALGELVFKFQGVDIPCRGRY